MFVLDATASQPYVLGREVGHRWEISGIIGITGDYQGVVSVRLSTVLANKLLEKTGVKTANEEERSDLLYGLIGELINIIAGTTISSIHASIDISPPLVVYGQNHTIAWPKTIPVIAIPFITSLGPFEVAVCFKYK